MAKVYPQALILSPFVTLKRETFTIWMKSLVYQTNGCTVFNSNGDIIYRVDNYDKKCSSEVYLMDLRGRVLFTIQKKKLQVFGRWDAYRLNGSDMNKKPFFRVKKLWRMVKGDLVCQISAGIDKYWIIRMAGKTAFRIVDINGDILAEAKRKLSSSGVLLGDDVLTMEVKPQIDHCFIMALVTVYGLICGQL